MKVREIMSRRPALIDPSTTVAEAARTMRDGDLGCLLIGEKDQVLGILTDRDIVVSALATASPYLERLLVGDIVTAPLVLAREAESLTDALTRMRSHGVRRMPVVSDAGALVGIVTFDDLLELLSDELAELTALVSREQRREAEQRI